MGSVWIARHLQLDIHVAVKFMTAEAATSANARFRFEREAKAAAKLKSAHIVGIMDYGAEGETLYIAMDLLSGEDLAQRIRRLGRLSLPAVANILGQACKGIASAHDAGIVHRDLKPANLFLAREGRDEVVKVLDFGIAKAPVVTGANDSTRTGSLIGSPNYMSPEQIVDSKAVDWRTDIWSLGVIAFQCLTGQEPFAGVEVGAILVGVCHAPIPVPSKLGPDLGPNVDRFFEVALSRPQKERFQSVLDFAQALHSLAEGETRGSASSQPPRISVASGTLSLNPSLAQAETVHPTGPLPAQDAPSGAQLPDAPTGLTGSISQATADLRPAGVRKAPSVFIVGLAAVVMGAGGLFLVRPTFRSRPQAIQTPVTLTTASTPAAPATSAGTVSKAEVSPAPTFPPPAVPGPSVPASAKVPAASAKPQRPKPPPTANTGATPRPVATPSVSANCDPNYTIDADGHKHFKLECFR
jgi:serine/threonine-protein kinase